MTTIQIGRLTRRAEEWDCSDPLRGSVRWDAYMVRTMRKRARLEIIFW